jgi:hypothetical protein
MSHETSPPPLTSWEVFLGGWRAAKSAVLWSLLALFAGGCVQEIMKPVAGNRGSASLLGMLTIFGILGLRYKTQIRRLVGWLESPPRAALTAPELAEPDVLVADDEDTVLGMVLEDGQDIDRAVCLDRELRNRHVYVIGKTRMGKTTLLKSMLLQDMERGDGVCLLDPHGDAAEDLLSLIPPDRIEDVFYFDPTDKTAPAFNPFALPFAPPKLAEDMVSVFRMLLGESWGPRMEHLLRFGVLSLLADPEPRTLRDLRKLYLDDDFRRAVLRGIKNDQLVEFWESEYPLMPKGSASPILNKLSAFLSPMSDLERVFSCAENALDFPAILAERKILLVNLAKGKIGEEPARLLGGLLVSGLQQAALARAALPEDQRTPFELYVDEFQNFTVSSFESILSESAKYKLNLVLANQNLGQLSSQLARSIFGNVGTIVAFQVSAEDASKLSREMVSTEIHVQHDNGRSTFTLADFRARNLHDLELAIANHADEVRHCLFQFGHISERMFGHRTIDIEPRNKVWRYVWSRLQDPTLGLAEWRQLFPNWTFQQTTFPDTSDFTTIGPHHAFCRIGRADLVVMIRCEPTPPPDERVRLLVDSHLISLGVSALERDVSQLRQAATTRGQGEQETPMDSKDFRE